MSGSLEIVREFTVGHLAAIAQKVAGDGTDEEKRAVLEALLRDELDVKLVERILKLADKYGRIIPRGIKSAVCDANRDFCLVQPPLELADYAARLARFQQAFNLDLAMSAADFEAASKKLIVEIKDDKALANLLNGVYLPVILPQTEVVDYWTTMKQVFVPAARSAYETQFPGRRFYDYREDDLAGNVSIVSGSRHDRLVARMKQGLVIGLYFSVSLQGFSVLASREQMAGLPESLVLSGGFDAFSAMAMYPDFLAKDSHTPRYDLSALSRQSPDYSLYLKASGGKLGFDSRGDLGDALGSYSSGLLFLGSA